MTSIRITLAGTEVEVRSDRTLYWPAEKTLFAADLHLGKGASFRAQGVPVPTGSTAETLGRLSTTLRETKAERLVLLGDLWHDRRGRTEEHKERWAGWCREYESLEIHLTIGNHDRGAGWDALNAQSELCCGPFIGRHHPEPSEDGYVLSGHLHPGFRVGQGRDQLRLPAFWIGERVAVLPAFGELTGLWMIEPLLGDRVFVVAETRVAEIPIRERKPSFRR